MTRAILRPLFTLLVLPLLLFLLTAQPAPASGPVPGEIFINEVLADPLTLSSEAVELYNATTGPIDLSGYWIDDIAAGGGTPQALPAGTVLAAGGHYVHQTNNLLNNGGDDVRLLSPDQSVVLDSFSYSASSDDMSWCRQPDGGDWYSLECEPSLGSTNGGGTPSWTPGTFEVHFLDVEQAHSHLFITPSGKTILIEAGETNWNSGQNAARIAANLQTILGHKHLDYIAVGHQHLDHIGYVGYGGIWALLEEHGVTAGALLDRDSGVWVDANHDNICDPDLEIVWHNAGTVSGTARNWLCYATDPSTIGGAIRQVLPIGSLIDFGDGVTMELVMQDAAGVMQSDGFTSVGGDHTAESLPPSENDYSQNWLIRYGSLDILTGSDTDGEYAVSSWSYTYNNIEAHVAAAVNQKIELLHVNHHGSSHSTGQAVLDVLQPDVAVISCSANSYGHPDQGVLDRLYGIGTDIYQTNLCDPTRDYSHVTITDGSFYLASTDGISYTVGGYASYVATDPVSYGPAGVLINEILLAPSSGGTEWVEFYNPTAQPIDISGTYVDDIAGGGGAAKLIPSGTVVPAGGYYVWETVSGFLNNSGDDVRYLAADGVTVYDSFSYGATGSNKSWYRTPSGGAWATTATAFSTKGATNP